MTNPSNLETSKGNNHKDRLAQLCKKRATIKGKLTLFKNYIATISASPTLSALEKQELELRLNKVDSVYSEYDMFQTEIETMSEDFDDESDESLRERQLFELQYYGAVSAARQLLQPLKPCIWNSLRSSPRRHTCLRCLVSWLVEGFLTPSCQTKQNASLQLIRNFNHFYRIPILNQT
ncbi:uncharacterized protein LOC119693283 [Plutella xylostella]|uniref:uncharacterized protein LOC119693283 n=1 Tax=Plutella xylostella TaxID=51655 RepID=UPI00203238EB|nr:uncharacterized protein LOC119693283 [Plutella xylostella]